MNKPRTIEGRWWLFGKRRRPHIGELKFSPETGLHLEVKIAQARTVDDILIGASKDARIASVIHGRDEHNAPISLFGCSSHGPSLSSGLTKYDIGALRAVLGKSFNSWGETTYCHVRLYFTSLHSWMARSHQFWKQEITKTPAACFSHARPPDITTILDNGSVISLAAEGGRSSNVDTESFTSGHHVSIRLTRPQNIDHFFKQYITPIRQMLSLVVGHTVFVKHVYFPDEDNFPPKTLGELLQTNHGVETSERDAYMSPVPFEEISIELPSILKKWFDYQDRFDSMLNLYFATEFNRSLYINHQFLFLAQALETYHNDNDKFITSILNKSEFKKKRQRIFKAVESDGTALAKADKEWLAEKLHHANQKTLADRLDDILNQYPKDIAKFIKNRADFAEKVRHTRNFYTHFDKDLERKGKTAKGNELVLLTEQMRTLLQVCVFRDIGIGDKAISRIIQRLKGMEMVSVK